MEAFLTGLSIGVLLFYFFLTPWKTAFTPDFSPMMLLETAHSEVLIEMYYVDKTYANFLCDLNKKAHVYIIMQKGDVETLLDCGIPVRKAPNFLHAKVIIVDREKTYVGSQNLARSSEDNIERGVILYQVQPFLNDFWDLWGRSQPFSPTGA